MAKKTKATKSIGISIDDLDILGVSEKETKKSKSKTDKPKAKSKKEKSKKEKTRAEKYKDSLSEEIDFTLLEEFDEPEQMTIEQRSDVINKGFEDIVDKENLREFFLSDEIGTMLRQLADSSGEKEAPLFEVAGEFFDSKAPFSELEEFVMNHPLIKSSYKKKERAKISEALQEVLQQFKELKIIPEEVVLNKPEVKTYESAEDILECLVSMFPEIPAKDIMVMTRILNEICMLQGITMDTPIEEGSPIHDTFMIFYNKKYEDYSFLCGEPTSKEEKIELIVLDKPEEIKMISIELVVSELVQEFGLDYEEGLSQRNFWEAQIYSLGVSGMDVEVEEGSDAYSRIIALKEQTRKALQERQPKQESSLVPVSTPVVEADSIVEISIPIVELTREEKQRRLEEECTRRVEESLSAYRQKLSNYSF